jgi:ATP-dependent Clp protease adaptor protein ClpS
MGNNKPRKGNTDENEGELDLKVKVREKLKKPSLYKVILLNDDFTPMDFVVYVLKSFFNKTDDEAHDIMMHVHKDGAGIAGVYSFEVAEMKSAQVNMFAKDNQHPLKSVIEKE